MSVSKGRVGEQIVADYWIANGYEIKAQNYTIKGGEIDVIVYSKEAGFIFCEVKTYQNNAMVHPLETITAQKQRRIRQVAQLYLKRLGLYDVACRFDVFVVDDGGNIQTHLENAF